MKITWTKESTHKEALKYKTRTEFSNGCGSAYNYARKKNILEEVCSHMEVIRKSWTVEDVLKEAKKYKTRTEFKRKSPLPYRLVTKFKIADQAYAHMAPPRNEQWTIEELKQEALKYNTIKELDENNRVAYNAIKKHNLQDQTCSHMKRLWEKKWNRESVLIEAKKYNTISELIRNSGGAYNMIRRLKLDEIAFAHMKNPGGSSIDEAILFKIIKNTYPNTKKLRDNNVKIEGKPFIKGFHIDIYIPELNKGIEFDDAYWHSYETMRKGHKNWPDEDLINYHQIKDDYFKSKGIDILHINEKEWLTNRKKCIKMCMKFLKN